MVGGRRSTIRPTCRTRRASSTKRRSACARSSTTCSTCRRSKPGRSTAAGAAERWTTCCTRASSASSDARRRRTSRSSRRSRRCRRSTATCDVWSASSPTCSTTPSAIRRRDGTITIAARRRTAACGSACTTPAPSYRRSTCRTSASASTRSTTRRRTTKGTPASAWRSPPRSCTRTAGRSRRKARGRTARSSPSPCRWKARALVDLSSGERVSARSDHSAYCVRVIRYAMMRVAVSFGRNDCGRFRRIFHRVDLRVARCRSGVCRGSPTARRKPG